jgi:hypothetical protein
MQRPTIIGAALAVILIAVGASLVTWHLSTSNAPSSTQAPYNIAQVLEQLPTNPSAVAAGDADPTYRLAGGYFQGVPPDSHLVVDMRSWYPTTKSGRSGTMTMKVTDSRGKPGATTPASSTNAAPGKSPLSTPLSNSR